jgi:hypothetical protein
MACFSRIPWTALFFCACAPASLSEMPLQDVWLDFSTSRLVKVGDNGLRVDRADLARVFLGRRDESEACEYFRDDVKVALNGASLSRVKGGDRFYLSVDPPGSVGDGARGGGTYCVSDRFEGSGDLGTSSELLPLVLNVSDETAMFRVETPSAFTDFRIQPKGSLEVGSGESLRFLVSPPGLPYQELAAYLPGSGASLRISIEGEDLVVAIGKGLSGTHMLGLTLRLNPQEVTCEGLRRCQIRIQFQDLLAFTVKP